MKQQPLLSICIAHSHDFHGIYFTINAIRLYFPGLLPMLEFVIVNNGDSSKHYQMLQDLAGHIHECPVKLLDMPNPIGTSPSRDYAIKNASGKFFLVCDCHVLFGLNALPSLINYLQENPDTKDLIQGPILYDNMTYNTHFANVWRGQMWGAWGLVWRSKRLAKTPANYFHVLDMDGQAVGCSVDMENRPVYVPGIPYAGHEQELIKTGHEPVVGDGIAPYPIPGQGLGVFAGKTSEWLGFNPHAVGFGGEEMYIHEKYRKAGRQALCLPSLVWMHRFGRPEGVQYPLTLFNKVRNYILEFQELGMDLAPVHEHFVASGAFAEGLWNQIVQDPINKTEEACKTCGGAGEDPALKSLEDLFNKAATTPRDLDQHLPTLSDYAGRCDHVTEISTRRESLVALVAAKPKKVVSFNTEYDGFLKQAISFGQAAGIEVVCKSLPTTQVPPIEETDFLFIDTFHNFDTLTHELESHAHNVRKYIAMHDTAVYGMVGDNGGPGLLQALQMYLRAHPEWSVVYHTKEQYGLTIISRLLEDKPSLPPLGTMAANFAKSRIAYAASGFAKVTEEEFDARLAVCSLCEHRRDTQCAVCGCYIEAKAAERAQDCPLALWPITLPEKK